MDPESRRQFFLDATGGTAFIALSSSLIESVCEVGLEPDVASVCWFLVQTDDANENANLFFQATFGIPDGVRIAMREFGKRFDEESQQEMAVVVIEAQPISSLNDETRAKLEQLGFCQFQQFKYNAALKIRLEELGIQ